MSRKRILVTGAAGFIGAELMRSLDQQGHEVIGIDNLSPYYSPSMKECHIQTLGINSKIQIFDICDLAKLKDFFELNHPQIVIHLAAQGGVRASRTSPAPYLETNQDGFFKILKVSEDFGVEKFLYASSSSVYGNQSTGPFREDMALSAPKSLYALSKLSNEIIAREYPQKNTKRIGLRFFTVYGPWGRPDMAVFRMLASSILRLPFQLTAKPDVLRDFTYINDLVETVFSLIEHKELPDNDIFNVAGGHPSSLQSLISYLDHQGLNLEIVKLPTDPLDVNLTFGSVEKLKQFELSVPSTKLVEGLDGTLDWMQAMPPELIREWYEYSK